MGNDVEGIPLNEFWKAVDKKAQAKGNNNPKDASSLSSRLKKRTATMFGNLFRHALHDSFGRADRLSTENLACFDVFGADVMFDSLLNPVLLEMNMSPNLWVDDHGSQNEPMLRQIKTPLVQQLAHWAALRSRGRLTNQDDSVHIEDTAFLNFTRIL